MTTPNKGNKALKVEQQVEERGAGGGCGHPLQVSQMCTAFSSR